MRISPPPPVELLELVEALGEVHLMLARRRPLLQQLHRVVLQLLKTYIRRYFLNIGHHLLIEPTSFLAMSSLSSCSSALFKASKFLETTSDQTRSKTKSTLSGPGCPCFKNIVTTFRVSSEADLGHAGRALDVEPVQFFFSDRPLKRENLEQEISTCIFSGQDSPCRQRPLFGR